ncbi:Holliday junction resolvase RusA (prophage-encoded endonuclease) [Prauserella flava]|nr:Holliday junction resolvase RusA (prophage-encoded endonuclease) [Prauserella flava]MCR3735831.1 Holliday junction resolvase RusA (prophage-encoded endonuclease) [Prauserella salsuginis]
MGNGVMVESSKRVKPWRADIREHVLARHDGTPLDGPIVASLVFFMPRPKSHYRTGCNAHLLRSRAPTRPTGKPDIDKLARAVLDALGSDGLNIWHDDAQVVELHASKHYIFAPDKKPGVLIRLNPLEG